MHDLTEHEPDRQRVLAACLVGQVICDCLLSTATDQPVNYDVEVRLCLPRCHLRHGPEHAVLAPAVEAKVVECRLECKDILATHGGSQEPQCPVTIIGRIGSEHLSPQLTSEMRCPVRQRTPV